MDFVQSSDINIFHLSHWLNISERMSPCKASLNLQEFIHKTVPNS